MRSLFLLFFWLVAIQAVVAQDLIDATNKGDLPRVQKLVEEGVDVNLRDSLGTTALMKACHQRHFSIVETLVSHGANLDLQDHDGMTALMVALQSRCCPIVFYLMDKGANIHLKNKHQETALHYACFYIHNMKVVRSLIKKGADIHARDINGVTPLISACDGNYLATIRYLVKKGAEINVKDTTGNTPLMYASQEGCTRIVKFLIKKGAYYNALNKNNESALMLACYHNHFWVAYQIKKKCPDQNIFTAAYWQYIEMLQDQQHQGASLDTMDDRGRTLINYAVRGGHWYDGIEYLIKNGVTLKADYRGYTPLMEAVAEGHIDIMEYLVEKGDSVNAQTNTTQRITALMIACERGDQYSSEYLINHGADVNLTTESRYSPLMSAVISGNYNLVDYLIQKGAKVNHKENHTGWNALRVAIYYDHTRIQKLLLEHGADMNDGLVFAASRGDFKTVKALVERGAFVNYQDPSDGTALQVALFKDEQNLGKVYKKIADYLRSKGAKE